MSRCGEGCPCCDENDAAVGSFHRVLHAVLDDAVVDRQDRAGSAAISRVYSLAERVGVLVAERDRDRANLALMREAHVAVTARAGELQRQNEAMRRDPSMDGVA